MRTALYGPDGFFVRDRPAAHFRTSAHSPHFARAIARLAVDVDAALGSPDVFDLVDVGAGDGELLTGVLAALPDPLRARVRAVGVEVTPREDTAPPSAMASPLSAPARAKDAPRGGAAGGGGALRGGEPEPGQVEWVTDVPRGLTGLLLATEWLDNVPLDLARDGSYLDASLSACGPLGAADADWVARWWPAAPGEVVEIGQARDEAWADAVGAVDAGLALAVDYGHLRDHRPSLPTATGFRAGREVVPAFDGTTDITCHVALDSAAAAAGEDHLLVRQREALARLGLDGARPPLALASADPVGYVRALAAASEIAELTAPAGLGAHWWLAHWTALDPRSVPLLHRAATSPRRPTS
ncbi:hypothetical protein CS0771_10530 [Catellatospora sp. IY07-71]|uniref:SAM-dependent methyltransferase n=1 Tax=Catellatospora sp. IY07-71 TaxID=2728827 RepID=UPI001BB40365|nr:SAM-dependent methyltransferase [Catellatospora sp. IY07-71]BCJ71509.1 hypothetical protein CS0771_10530 [Catellatospora sp. IY07-71]